MAKKNWTAESEQWLKDIHDYIFQDNPNAAIRTIEAIYNKAQVVLEFTEYLLIYSKNMVDILPA